MKEKTAKVSVVIPSFNCKKILFRLLNSLKKSDYLSFQVIIVDNGSKDGTLTEGRKKYRWARWVDAGSKNIGWGGAYNLGFAHARPGSHILMIDSDVVVDKEMITKLVKRLKKNAKIGIVTPMILYLSDKNWVNQAGASVNLWTGKVSIGWGPRKNFLRPQRVQNSGTVMLIRKGVIEKIGGFDDWFIGYLDPDFCLRAERAGYETWYEPEAIAYHDQSKDPRVWRPRVLSRAYYLGRNRTLFMRRHGNIVTYVLFLPLLFGYYFIESLRFGIFSKWLELIWGTFAGFFNPLKAGNKIPLPKVR